MSSCTLEMKSFLLLNISEISSNYALDEVNLFEIDVNVVVAAGFSGGKRKRQADAAPSRSAAFAREGWEALTR